MRFEVSHLVSSLLVQIVKNLPALWEIQVPSRVRKIPGRRAWQPTPVFLPGESHGQWSLAGYSPGVQSQTWLSDWAGMHHGLIPRVLFSWLDSFKINQQTAIYCCFFPEISFSFKDSLSKSFTNETSNKNGMPLWLMCTYYMILFILLCVWEHKSTLQLQRNG